MPHGRLEFASILELQLARELPAGSLLKLHVTRLLQHMPSTGMKAGKSLLAYIKGYVELYMISARASHLTVSG